MDNDNKVNKNEVEICRHCKSNVSKTVLIDGLCNKCFDEYVDSWMHPED